MSTYHQIQFWKNRKHQEQKVYDIIHKGTLSERAPEGGVNPQIVSIIQKIFLSKAKYIFIVTSANVTEKYSRT